MTYKLAVGSTGWVEVRVDTEHTDGWCFCTPRSHPDDVAAGRIEDEFNDRYQIFGRVFATVPTEALPQPSASQATWWRAQMLAAAAKSGDEGTIRLAMQLADCFPCPTCDFVASACRCNPPVLP